MKYSIVIPVHNAIEYLPNCISTIVNQEYNDYELIISDDHSTDGTTEYLESIDNSRIKVVFPPERMSMVEHFEWALQYASGEWVMSLGGDDGLQAYFFQLSDKLTELAEKNNVRAIMSSRAYYFWEGSSAIYGSANVNYRARKQVCFLNTKCELVKTLLSFQEYFELPEMYTTSMFRRSLLLEAKELQNGKIFSTVPPDANLAAIAMSLEKVYLKSFIPLGWVGTSSARISPTLELPMNGVIKEGVEYMRNAGHFHINSSALYFWNALLRTSDLRSEKLNGNISSRLMMLLIFSGVLSEIKRKKYIERDRVRELFDDLLSINRVSKKHVEYTAVLMGGMFKVNWFLRVLYNKVRDFFHPSYKISIHREVGEGTDMLKASINIREELIKRNII